MAKKSIIQNIEAPEEEVVINPQETPEWARDINHVQESGEAVSFTERIDQIPQWARVARGGYEVSSDGDSRFSALNARFAEGTFFGDVDVSGRSVEDVYQNIVKRSGKGLPPSRDSILYNPDLKTEEERQDHSYANGYLPLWSVWADQNPGLIAELARRSAGRTLTDRFASTSVSQARALSDIIRGRMAYFDDDELARLSPSRSRVSERALRDYDVYSLGIGKRSIDEFRSLIPDDVTTVIDTRHYTSNRFVSEYRSANLQAMFTGMGANYTWLRALSGVPADKRSKEDANWQEVSQSDLFRAALRVVTTAVERGEKVLLIGSDGNPEYGPRALFDAMELERESEIRVGHIDTTSRGPRVRSTEEVVKHVLGRTVIHNGDYLGVHFNEKRNIVGLDEGTNLVRAVAEEDVNARLITGNWNYSTPVEFFENANAVGSSRQELLRSAFTQANEAADHTVIFSAGDSDRDVRDQIGIAGHQGTRIHIPTHREDIYDPDRIAAAANRIRDRISRDLTWRMMRGNYANIDPNRITVAVGGANIARIANSYVEDLVPGEFGEAVRRARNNGSHEDYTGMKMDDISGISQDDINYFVTEVFRQLQSQPGEFGEEAEMTPWKLTDIISTGQSGAGEAAAVAAQSLGLGATVLAPKGWMMTVDDETLRGMDISDEAAFKNRFHLGYRNDVTLRNLQERLEERDRRSMMRDDGMAGGLTDRQIAVLYHLGFSNNALNDMMEVATANNLRIEGPADMAEFIRNCAEGYGIALPGLPEKNHVRSILEKIEQAEGEWNTLNEHVRTARGEFVFNSPDAGSWRPEIWNTISELQQTWNMKERLAAIPEEIFALEKELDALYLRTKDERVSDLLDEISKAKRNWDALGARLDGSYIDSPEDLVHLVTNDVNDDRGLEMVKTMEMFSAVTAEWKTLSDRAYEIRMDGRGRDEDIVDEAQIKKTWEDIIGMEKGWRENGVGYVTPMSPDYPQNLRDMDYTREADGVRVTRPAILWYKGDLSLLEKPSVSVTGSEVSMTESIAAARFLGGRLADEDIVLIANMSQTRRGATSAALQEHTEKGGRTVAITGEGIGDEAAREAQEAVVKRGGLVASTTSPDIRYAADSAVRYAEAVSQTAGTVVSIFDGAFRGDERANPASILADLSKVTFSLAEAAAVGAVIGVEKVHRNKVEAEKKAEAEGNAEEKTAGKDNKKIADIREVKANMEGVEEIVGTARNLQETAYLDKPDEEWKIRDAKETKTAKQEAVEVEPKDVRQTAVHILKLGADEIFFVSEAQEGVRKAVLEKYPNALFAAPSEEKGILARLAADEITLDGSRIAVHGEQRGASLLMNRDPDLRTEFFFRDRLLALDEVPNGAMGLADRTMREDNVKWFEWLKTRAHGLCSEFLSAVGMGENATAMRFDNADYIVVNRNSIELRRGDDITASIRLTDEGKVKVSNFSRLTDDLSEHYDEEHYPALTAKVAGGALNETSARALLDELREAVMERPHSETLALAAMTREERDERREKIDNGFLRVREDNVSVAIRDLAEGARLGHVSAAKDGIETDRLQLLATLMYEEKTAAKAVTNRGREYAREAKALESIPVENEKDREEAERRVDALYEERAKEAARLARIQELKERVVAASSLLEISRSEGQVSYSVDGGVIRLGEHKVSEKALLGAAAELERISGELDMNGYRSSAAAEIVSSIREENARKASEVHEQEQRKSEAEAAVQSAKEASRHEIVRDIRNGVYVVAVTGGVAYADKNLNVISRTYHELSEMTPSFGLAKNEKGQMKLIYPDGREVNGHWFDGISNPSEHMCVVKTDKGYNHLNLTNGQLVSREWRPCVGQFHDGLSLVKNTEGKYNYIDISGKPLLNNWVDRASDFRDGVANVILNGTRFEIDCGGNVLRNITQEQKKAEEKRQPSHQRRPGDN